MRTLFVICLLVVLGARSAKSQDFQIDMNQFDSWIFSNMQSAENARRLLGDRIEMEIDRITFSTPLRDDQIRKIRFAGKGDIKRFFDDVEIARDEFRTMQAKGDINQNNINDIYQLAMPLQQRISKGLFGKTSLLKKVAQATVDAQQAAEMRARDERLRDLKSKAAMMAFLANLGRQVPMTHAQREKILELMLKNVKISDPANRYVSYLIMFEVSELPRAELNEIFDEAQMVAIEKNCKQGVAMKATLKQMGLLE
jgi:hypothetical protein